MIIYIFLLREIEMKCWLSFGLLPFDFYPPNIQRLFTITHMIMSHIICFALVCARFKKHFSTHVCIPHNCYKHAESKRESIDANDCDLYLFWWGVIIEKCTHFRKWIALKDTDITCIIIKHAMAKNFNY